MSIYYEKCIRCGRKLKTEESQLLGFGKICYEKWSKEPNMRKLFTLEDLSNEKSGEVSDASKQ